METTRGKKKKGAHAPGLERGAALFGDVAGDALALFECFHEDFRRHERVDGEGKSHVAHVAEVVVELPQVPRLQRQVHL
jgi:hypothetical protein